MADELHLVIFRVGAELFGVPIAVVQEIIRIPSITRIPQAPDFVEGVINLRGRIITVMDLNKRLGRVPLKDYAETESLVSGKVRILVVELGSRLIGVIVDEVVEVLKFAATLIEPASTIIAGLSEHYVGGIGKLDDQLFILMDIQKLLTLEQQTTLDEMAPIVA